MYRNIYYTCNEDTGWRGQITLDTWDEEGKPITVTTEYPSHLYYIDPIAEDVSEFTTITGKPLVKKEFGSIFQRAKWIKEHPKVKLYDCLDPIAAFLQDTFYKINENPDFAQYPLKCYAWDIETAVSVGFPDKDNPRDPITCMTIGDLESYNTYTWVLLAGNWKNQLKNSDFKNQDKKTFFVFNEEKEMYRHFLNWFKTNRPDILFGWNIDSFDVPYTVNRIAALLSMSEVANALSPSGNMRKKIIKPNIKAIPYEGYRFEGLTILDYMQLYRDKFCKDSMVIDYKLETVCQEELGVGKLQYEGTFKQFYLRDFKTFVEYNIIDVVRCLDLEKKKKLIALTRYMCNTALCTYDKILAAQPVVIGMLNLIAKKQGQVTMSDDRVDPEIKVRPFEGAYVFPVEPSKCKSFATFDLNSLYPNIIISINISPETYVGQVEGYDTDMWTVRFKSSDKVKQMSKETFIKKFSDRVNIAPNGALFLKQNIRDGICPQFERKFYAGRKKVKKEMINTQIQAAKLLDKILKTDPKFDHENPMVKLDTDDKKQWRVLMNKASYEEVAQLGMKLALNSLYGLFSSKFSEICQIYCAEAITSSGRVIIQNSMAFIDKFMNRKFPNKPVIVLDKTGNQIELSNKRKYKVIRNEEEIEIYPESLRKGDKIIEI